MPPKVQQTVYANERVRVTLCEPSTNEFVEIHLKKLEY